MRIAPIALGLTLALGLTATLPAQADATTAPTASYITERPVADARDCLAIIFGAIARDGYDIAWMGESARPMVWVTHQHMLLASVHLQETPEGTRVDYRAERPLQAQDFEKALMTCK